MSSVTLTYDLLIGRLQRGEPFNVSEARAILIDRGADPVMLQLIDDVGNHFFPRGQAVSGEQCPLGCGGITRCWNSRLGDDGFRRKRIECPKCGERLGFYLVWDPPAEGVLSSDEQHNTGAADCGILPP